MNSMHELIEVHDARIALYPALLLCVAQWFGLLGSVPATFGSAVSAPLYGYLGVLGLLALLRTSGLYDGPVEEA